MTGHLKIAESDERPELFGIRRPTSTHVGMFGLATGWAADLAGAVPHGAGAATAVVVVAVGAFLKSCVRRKR
ncbi:hypothetical protein [Streptomyces mirabilis]|uniref:hypothetical protein n=1 Tax=Streptomyces mirabilis TaxID=68239 RepID=UPI00368CF90D